MTSRTYDVVLTVADSTNFEVNNVIVGVTSSATGIIAGIDSTNDYLKVKLNNILQEFTTSETIYSNVISYSGGSANTNVTPYTSHAYSSETTTATSTISAITPSAYIAEKNAFTQDPIVRLYTVYYPGEWYPPNEYGNPGGAGDVSVEIVQGDGEDIGYAWPNGFPLRFAEVIGDTANDISYNVIHNATSYIPLPVNISGFDQSSDGKINDASITIFNVDNIITNLVEDPYLVGYNSSNSVLAYVNGELVDGIDPRTVNANPGDYGAEGNKGFDMLTRARANGLAYDSAVVAQYGQANASFTYTQTQEVGGTWRKTKVDTRDLLGGVVEVKTTYAKFLDYWPEYSNIDTYYTNAVTVTNSLAYRVGDSVKSSSGSNTATVTAIHANHYIELNNTLDGSTSEPLYIINDNADPESYALNTFKIDQLESLSDYVASFGLVSWMQYFRIVTPKRKYYKNTCPWTYKGDECQYPGPNGGDIPGTSNPVLQANANHITLSNENGNATSDDRCAKSYTACKLRNNQIHFGGFPGTGRTVPRN